jgi:glutamate synthase (NADPH/NADH) small chain
MIKERIEPEKQEASKRIKNFDEVCLGYSKEEAIEEASRCLQCPKPLCVGGCPVNINIPKFIKAIKEDKADKALKAITKTNNLPGVCGRVCPQEEQCEACCILKNKGQSINIGKLERYAADKGEKTVAVIDKKKDKKIAVVGSGPSGLTCAADLALMGYKVTLFEALHKLGGVLSYGIPEFRLPKKIVEQEVEYIKSLGVDIKTNYVIGKTLEVDELLNKYDAVFIGSGAGTPYFMEMPGEDLNNVYSANEFLTRINLMKAYKFPEYDTPIKKGKKTIVIGGGNVAMDSARSARRLGADVTVVYRRSEQEMPAREEEIDNAKEEGIHFMMLTNPTQVLGDDKVEGIECIQMMLGETDTDGRRKPVPIENSEFVIDCDQVVIAIGQKPNPLLLKGSRLEHEAKGYLVVNENLQTSDKRVFAGGDIIHGDTVIKAMGDGKKAAVAIVDWFKQKKIDDFEK